MLRNLFRFWGVAAFAFSAQAACGADLPRSACQNGVISKDGAPVRDAAGRPISCFQTKGPLPVAEEPFEINPLYVGLGAVAVGGIVTGVVVGGSSNGSNPQPPFFPTSP
jgi:hypothetical protein